MTPPSDLSPAFGRADPATLGLSRRALQRMLRGGEVVQLLRGACVPAARAGDVAARAAATGLVLPPGAAVARRTAAWLHGVDVRGPGRHLDPRRGRRSTWPATCPRT